MPCSPQKENRCLERIKAEAELDRPNTIPLKAVIFAFQAKTVLDQMRVKQMDGVDDLNGLHYLIPRLKRAPYHLDVLLAVTRMDNLKWPEDYSFIDGTAANAVASVKTQTHGIPKDVVEMKNSVGLLPQRCAAKTDVGRTQDNIKKFLNTTSVTFACIQVDKTTSAPNVTPRAVAAVNLVVQALDAYGTQQHQERVREESRNLNLTWSDDEDGQKTTTTQEEEEEQDKEEDDGHLELLAPKRPTSEGQDGEGGAAGSDFATPPPKKARGWLGFLSGRG